MDQYLLKPITRAAMIEALELAKSRILEERERQDDLSRFARESQEYEHYARRVFFERLVSGDLSVPEIYEQAAKLELELDAESYNLVLFTLRSRKDGTAYSEQIDLLQEALIQDLLRNPDYLVFRAGILSYAILIKSTADRIGMIRSWIRMLPQECM